MGIVIENEFTVAAAPDDVYQLLVDVERVAPTIPGAEVLGRREDGVYDAKATVKMGPMSLTYKGTAEITESDPVARTAGSSATASESLVSSTGATFAASTLSRGSPWM